MGNKSRSQGKINNLIARVLGRDSWEIVPQEQEWKLLITQLLQVEGSFGFWFNWTSLADAAMDEGTWRALLGCNGIGCR